MVRTSDSRPEGLGSMPVPPNTLRVLMEYVLVKSEGPNVLWVESRVQETGEYFHANIEEFDIGGVSPSIVSSGNFAELIRTVTCMVANDRRTSNPLSR
ncbi:hypothetical protein TNCV_3733541 [Trichonephila clavipes]|nr:hypothetical protein TNCV_3733541 [Trichonephila clavipes]